MDEQANPKFTSASVAKYECETFCRSKQANFNTSKQANFNSEVEVKSAYVPSSLSS